jgi:hypothetical protein
MTIDLTDPVTLAILGLIGTWILVVGTLILMWWQTRQAQVLNSSNAVLALRERFDSDRMRASRRHLSQMLLKGSHEDIASTEVLTFLELVGTLTRRRLLDEELVWEAFGTWITTYYLGVRRPVDLIGQIRSALKDPMVFHNLEWIAGRVDELDRVALGSQGAEAVNQDLETRGFLSREAMLIDHWAPAEEGGTTVGLGKLLKGDERTGDPPAGPTAR